ncbi:MAG: DNA topoisomerase (ATP-hydrolyzing) subunit A [Rickettsia sp.]|nr:DNA topoisomerase (ATP-hydrolyzing) subunit A [Rickettsia sp.]
MTNFIKVRIDNEIQRSYLDYAMSVIVSRAIPDLRDGLKPVHRRILYAMYESGYWANKPYKKSARIVGDVIGKYHPHGDTAVYDALVRMAQEFSLRIPLIDGQGNFGSIDGDPAAAMRYTEAKLSKISHFLLEDIDKNTVEFQNNYDDSEREPKILPSVFPNLLVNGSGGIAVGMATNIPPHNLGEVIDACCAYIKNNNITIDEIISYIQGPDFPTAGTIIGTAAIDSAYRTGKGIITIRGKHNIEQDSDGKESVILTELPYGVNKSKLIDRILELIKEKKIVSISEIRDESNKEGIRIVINLKRNNPTQLLINQICSYTNFQTSFGIILLALKDSIPKVMNLGEIIRSFVDFREEIVTKRTIFLLNKARERAHILLGIRIAIGHIDKVIEIIKSSASSAEAQENLLKEKWHCEEIIEIIQIIEQETPIQDGNFIFLTSAQTKAILDIKLQRLTLLEKGKLEKDISELKKNILRYLEILSSREVLLSILESEFVAIKEKFNTPRATTIEHNSSDLQQNLEDMIKQEDVVVTLSHNGYIKRVALDTYKAQTRGGKGRIGSTMQESDIINKVLVCNSHDKLLFFTNLGKIYGMKIYKIPDSTPSNKGKHIANMIQFSHENEKIATIMSLHRNVDSLKHLSLVFLTSNGQAKRNSILDFVNIPLIGKIAIGLEENEELVDVKTALEKSHVIISTRLGKIIRFQVQDLRVFKSRKTFGIKAIRLTKEDKVVSLDIINGFEVDFDLKSAYLSISLENRLKIIDAIKKGDPNTLNPLLKNVKVDGINQEQILELAQNEEFILTIGERGLGKFTSSYAYRKIKRGGTGVNNMNINKKTGKVVAALKASLKDDLIIITNQGKIIRCKLNQVRISSRNSSGVKLFTIETNNYIVSLSLVAEEELVEEERTII